jgi:hypothetical protein
MSFVFAQFSTLKQQILSAGACAAFYVKTIIRHFVLTLWSFSRVMNFVGMR